MHPSSRFCGHLQETIMHLLDDCAGTHNYWVVHNININTLTQESELNLLEIAKFDVWIYNSTFQCNASWLLNWFNTQFSRTRKEMIMSNATSHDNGRPKKRKCLVIPDRSSSGRNCFQDSKDRLMVGNYLLVMNGFDREGFTSSR